MASKKKLATTAVALTTAAALLLGGTFAWQSINQTALNEASDVVNPGGRLHDDFDGESKNVYVENFAEDEIFARVRFDEYMEIIMNYGSAAEKTEVLTKYTDAESGELVDAVREDTSTYVTHIFGEENATDEFWDWTMGSADSDTAYYMPTFNLNKDSLAADVNGVFDGANFTITDQDHEQYDNYVDYSEVTEKTGYEIYDGDTNDVDELSRDHGQLKELTKAINAIIDSGDITGYDNNLVLSEEVTHTADTVGYTNGLISMEEWLALGEGEDKDNYWVYDTDGWVYWSSPIAAKSTTGLLMDGIALDGVMDDTWYYAINVVAQFVTANDVGKTDGTGFYDTVYGSVPTQNAEKLLDAIGVDMSGEAVTPDDGGDNEGEIQTLMLTAAGENEVFIDRGESVQISAEDGADLTTLSIDSTDNPMNDSYGTYDADNHILTITGADSYYDIYDGTGNFSGRITFNDEGEESTALPMAMTLTYNGVELEKDDEGDYIFTAPDPNGAYAQLTLQMVGGKITYEGAEVDSYHTAYHAHSTSTVDAELNGDEGIHYVTSKSDGTQLMTVNYHSGEVNVSPTDEEYVVQLQVEGWCYTNEDETADALAEGYVYLTVIPAGGSQQPVSGEPITLSYDSSSNTAFAGGHPWLTPNDDTLQMVATLNSDGSSVDASALEWSVTGGGEFYEDMSYTTITPSVSESGLLKVENDTNDMLGYKGYPITVTATYGDYSDSVTVIFTDASGSINCEVVGGDLSETLDENYNSIYSGASVNSAYTLSGSNQCFNGQPVDDGVYDYEWVVTDESGDPTENASVDSNNQFIATAAGTYKVTWGIVGCTNEHCSETITIIVE